MVLIFYLYITLEIQKGIFIILLLVLIFSPYLFEYFDEEVFETYLFFDLDRYYYFIGGEVSYLLSLLHSIIFFLGYNRKKNLIG